MALRRRKPKIHEDRVYLGRIVKPHALKGELKFLPFGISALSLESFGTLKLEPSDREYEIEYVRGSEKAPILKLKTVDTRTGSEELCGSLIWIEDNALPDLKDDAFYESDIIYSQAVNVAGDVLGRVEDIIETGECDVLAIRDGTGRELLIPANRENVKEIRREENTIVVDPPEELIRLMDENPK